MRMSVREMNRWVWAICLPVWFIVIWNLAPPLLSAVIPSSLWMVVNKVFVNSTRVGEVQTMEVDRTIYRDFRGSFNVQIRRAEGGGFAPYCSGGEDNLPYRVDATLPDPTTLGWWIGAKDSGPCEIDTVDLHGKPAQIVRLPPGQYYVITQWTIPTILGAHAVIENQSNAFEVTP